MLPWGVGLTIEVVYESAAGLLADFEGQLRMGGLFAQVGGGEALPPFAELAVALVVDGQPPIRVTGRLTSATAETLCVEIAAEARDGLAAAVVDACQGAAPDGAPGRRSVRLVDEAAATPSPRAHQPLTLDRRIAGMSVSEKVQMALHGNREERQFMMKERAGVIQASLVRNPKMSLDEITALARLPHLAPDAAEAMSQHPSHGASPQVALALVRNPRTPVPIAIALVAKLSPADLRGLAKGLNVRAPIQQAARKRLFDTK